MRVSVVVPAHNEEGNLQRLYDRLTAVLTEPEFEHELELVLVDDDSTDRTPEICDRLAATDDRVRVVHRRNDPGFGNAIKAGLREGSGDVLIPFMGDLSDDPADIPKLVAAIERGYDVAYGSRFMTGGSVDGYPPLKLLYNRAFNNLIRLTFGIQAHDVTNAFTAYHREVIDEIDLDSLESESFDLTAELPLRAHIEGFRSTEVPVSWRSRDAGVSKLNATRKGPVYLKRLLSMFFLGNAAALRDLLSVVTDESKLRVVAAAAFGVVILVGLFSVTGFGEVFESVRTARPEWLVLAAGAYLTTFAFRTWRYRVLLRTSEHLASRGGVFRCILASWFVNFIIPARAGDAVRGLALKSTEDVPFSVATGLVVVERALDMTVLGLAMVSIATFFVRTRRTAFLAAGAIGIAGILVVGLAVLYLLADRLPASLHERFPRIEAGLDALNDAIQRVARNPQAVTLAFLLSFPVWAFEASTVFLAAQALGLDIRAVGTATAAVAGFIAQAVPVTPAGIGTYEATIVGVLSLFGVDAGSATALALLDHFVRVGVVYVFGAISVVHIGFRSRAYFRERDLNVTAPVRDGDR